MVESRGIKEETEGGIIVPGKYLDNSDVCTVEGSGVVVLRKRGAGRSIGDARYILDELDILGVYIDGELVPSGTHVLARKCLDPEEQEVITLGTRKTQFVEILAAGDESALKDDVGKLAYVDASKSLPQKVEETIDDWIIRDEDIEFVIGD